MRIDMPENANKIITVLEKAGYEAYIVGGCVRDSILGRVPGDWDITTSAKPEQVKKLFRRTIDTGIQHGTVTVMLGDEGYEVTTYRVDGEYTDHRRPDEVQFTTSLEEDLKRRDFTINAMAYSESRGIIDLFGGMDDLDNKIIKAVGVASERFDEDALRILRAVRFAGQLGFEIEDDTKLAMSRQAKFLQNISAERIHVELEKLLISDYPEKLIEAYELGITKYFLPEFDRMMETEQNNPYHMYTVGKHAMVAVKNIEATPVCRFAALLHDVGKPDCKTTDEKGVDHFKRHPAVGEEITKKILRRLKFDNDSIKLITKMVFWHDYGMGDIPSMSSFRKIVSKMGKDFFPYFIQIKQADMAAQSDYMMESKIKTFKAIKEMYQQIITQGDCLSVKDLAIGGKELMELGVKPGKTMGEILNALLDKVLEKPELNTKETLEDIVRNTYLSVIEE